MEKRTALAPEELAGLYRRHIQMVYQICLLMLKNVPDAEDAAQTVFRKRLERGPALQDPEREKAWLIVTARNECRDQLKHWWRTRRADPEELDRLTWQPPEEAGVWEQVAALPARERQLVLLRYGLAGQPPLTQLETAQLLGISRSYVSRLESHALDLLRRNWKN